MKKALIVAHNSRFIAQFELNNIAVLQTLGYEVHCATNFEHETMVLDAKERIEKTGAILHQFDIERLEWSLQVFLHNIKACGQLKKILDEDFDLVHCHTPMGGVVTRLAALRARKRGTKVFYTAHGFHFFKGAPLLNWLIYFTVEWLCSFMTDTLITINQEDYTLAKKHMHAKRIEYVPGVGIDIDRFANVNCDRAEVRRNIGVPEEAIMLLSVGELNENKNHQVIINAMSRLQEMDNLHYVVAGFGPNEERLKAQAHSLGLSDRVHILGYRTDIPELNKAADIFCFPSHREGLGLAALEAMASGIPIITSNVHGINDYSKNGVTGFKCAPDDVQGFADAIRLISNDQDMRKKIGNDVRSMVRKYNLGTVLRNMQKIYDINGYRHRLAD